MQPPKDSDSPKEHPPLRINLAEEMIDRRKFSTKCKSLLLAIGRTVLLGILCVVSIPFLPFVGLTVGSLHLIHGYKECKHKAAIKKGILTNELSASPKTTAYLSGRDISGILGRTDIEYSQSAEKASFKYRSGNGRYYVYGTREEGLFLLVPVHRKIDPEKYEKSSYYQCDVVRVNGGYNHGDFGEKSPMGSHDCIVLVCRKASKIPPSKDLIVITASDAAQEQRIDVGPVPFVNPGLSARGHVFRQ